MHLWRMGLSRQLCIYWISMAEQDSKKLSLQKWINDPLRIKWLEILKLTASVLLFSCAILHRILKRLKGWALWIISKVLNTRSSRTVRIRRRLLWLFCSIVVRMSVLGYKGLRDFLLGLFSSKSKKIEKKASLMVIIGELLYATSRWQIWACSWQFMK